MKRIYQTLLLALSLNFGMAQTAFWTPTTYKGAFDCSTSMWTDSWTEWDPQNKVYPAATMTVNSNITTNTTWATGQTILLQGPIFVKNNSVLTIQPGVIVLGDKGTPSSALIITKGSQLQAVGTASNPIVFTSNQPVGASNRSVGDWGGIILCGQAQINVPGGIANIEGLTVSADTEYGSTSPNNNDNSGTLKYVRIEFGGYVFAANKEINGLTMGGVGKATTIDHIQCSFTNDDGFEWFGGTVNAKYLVSFRNLDDDFDTDFGYSGMVQFGLIVRDPALADVPAVSTSEGFESDNDATGSSNTPLTSGIFSNITAIGPYRGSSSTILAAGYERALRLRRNTNLKVFNSIFTDFKKGLHVDGTAADANAGSGALKFKYNVIATTSGITPKTIVTTTANTNFNTTWFGTNSNDSLVSTSGLLVTPYNYTSPDYRPVCTNTLVSGGANFSDPAFVSGGILGVNEFDNSTKLVGLYPNPSTGETNLVINTTSAFTISADLYSVTGQLVAKPYTNYNVETGMNVLPINATELANGIYFITVQYGSKTETIKLVVNK
ncbi:MAG: T9SS type A sorting domain-containing protein [Sphingobacteriaceae bacterium]|nr:T9SS type A sorting domain-containing protein [Sphingobacteriaceae bacterium]